MVRGRTHRAALSGFPWLLALLASPWVTPAAARAQLPGFERSPWFGEQVREERTASGVRILFNAPGKLDARKPTLLIFYATPNGNTIEQTMGCKAGPGVDWHFDIQHTAAQTRALRAADQCEDIG